MVKGNNLRNKISYLTINFFFVSFLSVCLFGLFFSSVSPVNGVSLSDAHLRIVFMNQDPDPVGPNDYVKVRFKIEKLGNDLIKNITFKVKNEYPFYLDKNDSGVRKIGDWKGYSVDDDSNIYYVLYYKLRVANDVLDDEYDLNLYYKVDGWSDWAVYKAKIRVNNDRADFAFGNLVTFPKKVYSDSDNVELDVELQNIGEKDAQNVILKLDLPNGFEESYGYSNRVNYGTIGVGKSKIGKVFVDIDKSVSEGDYFANATIFYKEVNSNRDGYLNKSLRLRIPVSGRPKFEVLNYSVVPEELVPGKSGYLRVYFRNVGSEEGESVSVKVFKESSQPFEFDEKTDYLGNLKSNDVGEAVFRFKVKDGAVPKDYNLKLSVRSIYKEEVLVDEESVKLKVILKKNGLLNKNYLFAGLGVLFVVVLFFLFLKNKGSENSKFNKKNKKK